MQFGVVVPVKDGAPTLGRCLDALLRAGAAEIVVVDDGSTDGTAALARRYPVRLVQHPENRGTSAARNTGWRALGTPLVAFVDADVEVAADSLRRLCAAIHGDVVGANGIFALEGHEGAVSRFVNTSIHYQHLQHGTAVASAFTAICVFRRDALAAMGGWDERFSSRYADDVGTRFHLPAGGLRMVPEAQGRHLKTVPLRGLLRHRFNIGWFYVGSLRANQEALRPGNAVLAARYPLNTAVAALSLIAPGMVIAFLPVNAHFATFVARRFGARDACVALGLSAAEGYAYLFGLVGGAIWGRRA